MRRPYEIRNITGGQPLQPGAYFVTLCTHNRAAMFGRVVDEDIVINALRRRVCEEWFRSAETRAEIELCDKECVVSQILSMASSGLRRRIMWGPSPR